MSTTAVIPPPSSSSLVRHLPKLTARARALLTALNLHYAGIAALTILVMYMVVHALFLYRALGANNAEALNQQRALLTTAELQAKPLRGLDRKIIASATVAETFYQGRLAYSYSQVLAELGVLTKRTGVRLVNAQYAQSPILSGPNALTEVRIDASVSGDYRPVVEFINALERDRMFFVISSINLTGQQTGQVNLRIRLTTYLRTANGKEATSDLSAAHMMGPANSEVGGVR